MSHPRFRLNLQSWLPTELHPDINHMLVGFGQVCANRRFSESRISLFMKYPTRPSVSLLVPNATCAN